MNIFKIIFFIVTSLIIEEKILSAQHRLIEVKLNGPFNKKNDIHGFCFSVTIEMTKGNVEKIIIPHCIKWSYSLKEYDSSENNGVWIIEKFQNKEYSPVKIRTEVIDHGGICYDSLGNELFDTLSLNKPIVFKKSVAGYYEFNKGSYRAKVRISISISTDTKCKEFYSDWIYFKVK